jgi:hypothetical protein
MWCPWWQKGEWTRLAMRMPPNWAERRWSRHLRANGWRPVLSVQRGPRGGTGSRSSQDGRAG